MLNVFHQISYIPKKPINNMFPNYIKEFVRSDIHAWKGLGILLKPWEYFSTSGFGYPRGTANSKRCSIITMNMNNSIVAKDSPRQARFPIPNGTICGTFC